MRTLRAVVSIVCKWLQPAIVWPSFYAIERIRFRAKEKVPILRPSLENRRSIDLELDQQPSLIPSASGGLHFPFSFSLCTCRQQFITQHTIPIFVPNHGARSLLIAFRDIKHFPTLRQSNDSHTDRISDISCGRYRLGRILSICRFRSKVDI